jgi:hypothetical protein
MDPRLNPYAPGAGTPPPELAGRDDVLERAAIALDRIRNGRAARSVILYGLRGVGKTVLLNKIRQNAEARGFSTAPIEAPEERSLPALLIPALRSALIRLNRGEALKSAMAKAMGAVGSVAKALKLKYQDIEVGIDLAPERGVADSGDLETDLADLFIAVGAAAQEKSTAFIFAIDELQYIPEDQFAALIAAIHRVSQHSLPITLIAAGLPQLLGNAGRAKSYAERLFEFVSVDKLDADAAISAVRNPALRADVGFSEEALSEILRQTQGYPYFLQEWGKHCWDLAQSSPIEVKIA